MSKIKHLLLFLLLIVCTHNAKSENSKLSNEMDSVKLSLLTCAPGNPIYTLFGHTAIRYQNPQKGIDAVFNYGLFRFNAPNFIWRVSLGEIDYELGVESFERFNG